MLQSIQEIQEKTWLTLFKVSKVKQAPTPEIVATKPVVHSPLDIPDGKLRPIPRKEDPYRDDVAFARILDFYLSPEIKKQSESELKLLANAAVSEQVMAWVAEAERCPPQVQHWDSWGEKKDVLVTSQGWKYLLQLGTSERLAAIPSLNEEYGGYGRMIQMLKGHLFGPSSATSMFHLILSNGVASLLSTHLHSSKLDGASRALFQHAYERLTSTNGLEGWLSGLWLTERGGGSDLTPTETTATYSPLSPDDDSKDADGFPLGPWVLNGFKWFSTSTEANMAIAIARTAKGLSAFFVPMRRTVTIGGVTTTELNGVRIRRLKQKLGTKPLPTAELEINGMRGWLIGKEGKGINEVGVVLNVTRIHLNIGVLGAAGRALSAARSFARVRKVARGTPLSSMPLHMRTLGKAHVTYRAQMMLGFFVTALLAKSEKQQLDPPPLLDLVPKSSNDVSCLLRLLGSVVKASSAMDCCGVVQTAMESLGGVGYLENGEMYFNVARLWRDTSSVLIGEGTTDVLATDVVKVMKGKIGSYVMQAYGRWVKSSLPKNDFMAPEVAILSQQWLDLQAAISSNSLEYLTMNGREIMDRVCKLTSSILLLADSSRDNDPVAMEVARRWIRPTTLLSGSSVEKELMLDQLIVFGEQRAF
ncbi:hypothetical protein ACHAPJ_010305 [Fusarium lateritium]